MWFDYCNGLVTEDGLETSVGPECDSQAIVRVSYWDIITPVLKSHTGFSVPRVNSECWFLALRP